MTRRLLLLFALTAASGCPPAGPGDPSPTPTPGASASGGGDPAAPDSASVPDPLAGSVYSREQLFAIYAAYQSPDPAERTRVLRQHDLIDGSGAEVPARAAAFQRALQRYAELDPAGWTAFLETLPP